MPTPTMRDPFKVDDGVLAITIPKACWIYDNLTAGDRLQVVTDRKLIIHQQRLGKDINSVWKELFLRSCGIDIADRKPSEEGHPITVDRKWSRGMQVLLRASPSPADVFAQERIKQK